MSPQRIMALVLGLALVGAYGYRAVIGIGAGVAWDDGIHEILSRDYSEAIPSLQKAAVGFNRYDMQRRTGDARIDVFEAEAHRGGPFGADTQLIHDTGRDYMEALCSSPAARHPWEGLALVYQKLEWMGRERRTEQPFVRGVEPWSRVGRSGRIAIGMARQAIETAPSWYLTYDWMAETFWLFGLEPEARDAVRRSAKALPLFYRHAFARRTVLPGWEKELFFESSREVLGLTPLLPRANHLVDLGKQARGRGAHEDAVEVLTQALGEAKYALVRAEAHFNLGLSLVALGRDVDGREQLILASEHPVFHEAALWNLVLASEKVEDYAGALTYVRELQREQPRELEHCLRAARLASMLQDWPVALEALRWGKVIAPSDPRPYVREVETYLEMGDLTSARTRFRDVDAWGGEAVPESLRRRLAED